MSSQYESERAVAIDAVRAAGKVCRAIQQRMVSPETLEKKDRSPVTVADFASQAVVCAHLEDGFNQDAVVAEENSAALREDGQEQVRRIVVEQARLGLAKEADEERVLGWIDRGATRDNAANLNRFWTLDPIDGTKGFLRGGQYAVALALIENGNVVLGAVGCPNLPWDDTDDANQGTGVIMVAARGQGAQEVPLDGGEARDIRVSDIEDPSVARFCESVESGHSSHGHAEQVAGLLGITADPVRMDSQAKYGTVARGRASIYMRLPTRADYREMIWDHAAGMIVVEEAGGRVTDVAGRPLDFTHGHRLETNAGALATNGKIHDAVLNAIREVLPVPAAG